MENELIRVVDIAKVWHIEPDPVTITVPEWPASSIIPMELKDEYEESELRSFAVGPHSKFTSPKPIAGLVQALPEDYCKALLFHVMYRHQLPETRLPVYLGDTIIGARQGLTDIVLAANMAREIFTRKANTTNPTTKAEARNWLQLARHLEYAGFKILKDTSESLRVVIAKSTGTWGTGELTETDHTYYLDSAKLAASGLTAEAALAQFKQSQVG